MDPVSFFLIFLAIALIGAALFFGGGSASGVFRRRRSRESPLLAGFDDPVASLPPVLLPAEASPADVDRIRFSLGLRGYRMDQVDQVLDDLRDQLAAKDHEIERLRMELRTPAQPGESVP
ncbi:DivIVA domain-containing protein [Arthrobacter sp. NPDC058288]|uniref:DivIVA domain-containing protein n=1 Tax=Arthrobacter sp. NPDC058288 TaxID=3346424 RepID=UPI0036E054B6